MASHNLSYSGSTSVLEASASVTEKTTTGTSRTLHLSIFVKPIDYSGARTFGYSVSCAGVSSSGSNQSLDGSGMTIFDKDITVSVPYGQTYATVDCSFSATVVSPSAGNKTINGTITKITGLTLRYGSTSITSASNVNFGSACSITWTPSESYLYNKLKFALGSWSYTTALFCPNTTSSYTYTGYTIPYSAAQQIPNATTATMTVTLYTYENSSGTSQVGSSSSASFTVTLPASVKPSITSWSIAIDNSANSAVSAWEVAVAGFTGLRVVANASGSYGSTISRFKIEGAYSDTVSASSLDYTGSIVQSSGAKTVTITCVDSRGRESASITTEEITFLSYTAPLISQFTAERNSDGYAVLKAIYTYDSVSGNNSATATLYYRKTGSSAAWIQYGTISNNTAETTDILLSDESSYNFKLVLTDATGSSVDKTAFLSTANVLLDFKSGGDGLGIGKICENPGMEVSMDTTFYSSVKIGEVSLEQYIQNIMKILPSDMYGSGDPPTGAVVGQIYFKKL